MQGRCSAKHSIPLESGPVLRTGLHRRDRRGIDVHHARQPSQGIPERRPALALLHPAQEASGSRTGVARGRAQAASRCAAGTARGSGACAFVGPGAAAAAAQTTLADVKSIRCTFTRQTTGSWAKGDAPETAVRPSSLVLRFEAIDAETGTAQLRNGAMTTDVTVRLAEGYLHLMQAFRTGPLYMTTVFDAGATARRLPGGAFPPRTLHDTSARRNLQP